MVNIPDDPFIQSMERTGYPPGYFNEADDDGIWYVQEEDDEDE